MRRAFSFLVLFVLLLPSFSWACSYYRPPQMLLAGDYKVIIAAVEVVEHMPPEGFSAMTANVIRVFRGEITADTITIHGDNGISCLARLNAQSQPVGSQWVFQLYYDESKDAYSASPAPTFREVVNGQIDGPILGDCPYARHRLCPKSEAPEIKQYTLDEFDQIQRVFFMGVEHALAACSAHRLGNACPDNRAVFTTWNSTLHIPHIDIYTGGVGALDREPNGTVSAVGELLDSVVPFTLELRELYDKSE